MRGGQAKFRLLWHRNRSYDLILDTRKKTLSFPKLLPAFPEHSMFVDFETFVESRHARKLPPHRRINPRKARAKASHRKGDVALTLTLSGDDYDFGTRKLIHLVHEIFLEFLAEGKYFEYQIEAFDLDPDRPF